MATEYRLPDLGEDIEDADVIKVLVKVGDTVKKDQALLEIETEKATLDVPAPADGTITEIHVREGQTIHPGEVILSYDAVAGAAQAAPQREEPRPEPAPEPDPEPEPSSPEPPPPEPPSPEPEPEPEPEPVGARTEAAAAAPRGTPEPDQPVEMEQGGFSGASAPAEVADQAPVFASPAVRRFAREIGVDIQQVKGSGPGGRISEDDVKQYSRTQHVAGNGQTGAAAAPRGYAPLPDFAQFGAVERVPLSRLRRTIKRNMTTSWSEIPHVTLMHKADVTELEAVRQQYKQRAEQAGGRLTVTAIMLKIVAAALKAHPNVNSSLDAEKDELILKHYINVGVAIDTPRGLVVPVISDVDKKNIIQLAVELTELSQRARDNELTLDDFRGGTFAITNLGGMETGHFTPIIQHPQVGILGIGKAEMTPLWEDGKWLPRLILPLSFVFDHRVIDGADGARFMSWMSEAIRSPLVLALEG